MVELINETCKKYLELLITTTIRTQIEMHSNAI